MHTYEHSCTLDGVRLVMRVVHPPVAEGEKLPAVLVAHDWWGRNAFACDKASGLAAMGYVGIALDMYGEGRTGASIADNRALMQPLLDKREIIAARMQALLASARSLPVVDPNRVAAIGFCFGGLCVLDLARSGADVKGVISFHGLLGKSEDVPVKPVAARILAFHGYDDPMVRPADVEAFCDEMTQAGADWQVHMFGHTKHAFMNPQAHDDAMGTVYSEVAERRALAGMVYFLRELFAQA